MATIVSEDEWRERQRRAAIYAAEEAAEIGKPCDADFYVRVQPTYMRALVDPDEVRASYAQAYERITQEIARLEPITKFVRVLRDCPHNKTLGEGAKRGLIYDWHIEINGELFGRFSSAGGGTTLSGDRYRLADREGQAIKANFPNSDGYSTYTPGAKKRDHFLGVLARYLDLMPTSAEIDARNIAKREAKAAAIVSEKEQAVDQVLKKHAAAMFELLKLLAAPGSNPEAQALALVSQIEGEVADWHAAIDKGE